MPTSYPQRGAPYPEASFADTDVRHYHHAAQSPYKGSRLPSFEIPAIPDPQILAVETCEAPSAKRRRRADKQPFACPYYQYRYTKHLHQGCALWHSTELKDVKDHCRWHLKPFSCGRCKKFRTADPFGAELGSHLSSTPECEKVDLENWDFKKVPEYITYELVCKEPTWKRIFAALFYREIPEQFWREPEPQPESVLATRQASVVIPSPAPLPASFPAPTPALTPIVHEPATITDDSPLDLWVLLNSENKL